MTAQAISPLSSEYIRVPVTAIGITSAVVKQCLVDMAFVPFGYTPSEGDWNGAGWADGRNPTAICLVGPQGGIVFSARTAYDVWLRITTQDAPQFTAVIRSGTIRTTPENPTSVLVPAQFDQRAVVKNLAVTLGDDLVVPITAKEGVAPYDWTGAVIEANIRTSEYNGTLLGSFTIETPVAGTLNMLLSDTLVTSFYGMDPAPYYSLRVTKNAITRTWIKGQIIVSPAA